MKKKLTIFRGLLFIVAIPLLGMYSCSTKTSDINRNPGSLEASWVKQYDNLEQLTSDSSMIVIGTIDRVLDVQQDKMGFKNDQPGGNLYHTLFAFKVETSLKGQPSEEISLWQTGAEGKAQLLDDPLFQVGYSYLLFLKTNNPGIYFGLGPWGRYEVINQRVYSLNYTVGNTFYQAPPDLDFNGVNLDVLKGRVASILNAAQ